MRPSTDLHKLLISITPSEKRFLKIHSGLHNQGDQNKYALLMELIWNQRSYDENPLKQEYALRGGDPNQFASVKNYLFQFVLDSLREFRRRSDPQRETVDLISDVTYLQSMGLFDAAEKLLHKAARMAEKYELHEQTIHCHTLLRQRIVRFSAPDALEQLNRLEEDSLRTLKLQNLTIESSLLYFKTFQLARRWFSLRDESTRSTLDSIRLSPTLEDAGRSTHFRPLLNYYRTQALLHQLEGEASRSFETQAKLFQLWKAFPHMKNLLPGVLITTLANYLGICHTTMHFQEMPAALAEIKEIEATETTLAVEVQQNFQYYTLLYSINCNEWDQALIASEELLKIVERHRDGIPKARVTAIIYNIAVTFFLLQRPKPALQSLNAILNDAQSQHREDIQQAARLMQAVVHYQLGNTDLLEHLLRNAQHYMKKKGTLYTFEATLVRHLRQLIYHPESENDILQNLQKELRALKDDPANANAPGLEEIQYWIKSKLLGVPLHTLVGSKDEPHQ